MISKRFCRTILTTLEVQLHRLPSHPESGCVAKRGKYTGVLLLVARALVAELAETVSQHLPRASYFRRTLPQDEIHRQRQWKERCVLSKQPLASLKAAAAIARHCGRDKQFSRINNTFEELSARFPFGDWLIQRIADSVPDRLCRAVLQAGRRIACNPTNRCVHRSHAISR